MNRIADRTAAKTPGLLVPHVLTIVGTGVLVLLVLAYGQSHLTPSGAPPAGRASARAVLEHSVLPRLILSLVVIIIACRLTGWVFRALRQPPVVGEVIAGILLGPSLLGRIAPGAMAYLLPEEVGRPLNLIANLGLILYMFIIGLELDAASLWRQGHAVMAISHASIAAPLLLGVALAAVLYSSLAPAGVPFPVFALFLGVAMSVTAFPVLARILTDRGASRSPLGIMALGCAAVDDVTAWCLLALVAGVARAQVAGAIVMIVAALAYGAVMLFLARPVLRRVAGFDASAEVSQGVLAAVLVGLLLSAWTTESLGIHAVFGAFLFGTAIPHDSAVARQLGRKLQDIIVVLLLPAFFADTGMRTQLGLVHGHWLWMVLGAIICAATAGKFGGTLTVARLAGLRWGDAAALGVLMNTRGLMELVVLNVGLDLGIIPPALFTMMVLMAIVTTAATAPLLDLLARPLTRRPSEACPYPTTLRARDRPSSRVV